MSAFDSSRRIEAQGMMYLMPLLRERAHDGQFVVTNKGALAPYLQEAIGDIIFNSDADRFYTVEVKVEARHTGRLFLEVFSNRNLENRASNADRGINVGWMFKLRADLLFYYFVDTDDLYILSFFKLQQWAFGSGGEPGRIWRYQQAKQSKYQQLNDTWGWLVHIEDIPTSICKRVKARQISLLPEEAGA